MPSGGPYVMCSFPQAGIEWRPLVVRRKCCGVERLTSKMATGVRQELAQLMNSSGSHKDLAGKYVFSSNLPVLVLTLCLLHECFIV